ncbi:response regulator [Trujillonella humicola]|uniref:response regulator n=1 Tax=Trujillonella humicola TaxID=3383699 RepID=UPI0039058D1E
MPIRVLVVDDHPLIRRALVELFGDSPGIEVVGECADGCEVLEAAERTRPDVVLMDVKMPVMDGLEATCALLAAHPEMRVVILTGALTPATACEAQALGAAGYLLKEENPGELPDRVREVAAGGTAWSPAAAAALGEQWRSAPGGTGSPHLEESPARYR